MSGGLHVLEMHLNMHFFPFYFFFLHSMFRFNYQIIGFQQAVYLQWKMMILLGGVRNNNVLYLSRIRKAITLIKSRCTTNYLFVEWTWMSGIEKREKKENRFNFSGVVMSELHFSHIDVLSIRNEQAFST